MTTASQVNLTIFRYDRKIIKAISPKKLTQDLLQKTRAGIISKHHTISRYLVLAVTTAPHIANEIEIRPKITGFVFSTKGNIKFFKLFFTGNSEQ